MNAITKLQMAMLQSKVKAALSAKGEVHLRGLSLKAEGRHLTVDTLVIKSDNRDVNFNMDSIESISEEGTYNLEVEVNGLKFVVGEKEFSIGEVTLVGMADVKEFYMNIKGMMDALK